jgi:RimJ/RimL family protein N-acetyltransferase
MPSTLAQQGLPRLFCKPVDIPYDNEILYREDFLPLPGTICFRSLQLSTDLDLIHGWVNQVYARRFWQLNGTKTLVENTYAELLKNPQAHSFIGLFNYQPVCQVDLYLIAGDELRDYVNAGPDDCGLHFLMSPPNPQQKGLTVPMLRTFLEFYFSFQLAERIYAEPDKENDFANLLARKVGFQYVKTIELSYKTANLYRLTSDYFQSTTK